MTKLYNFYRSVNGHWYCFNSSTRVFFANAGGTRAMWLLSHGLGNTLLKSTVLCFANLISEGRFPALWVLIQEIIQDSSIQRYCIFIKQGVQNWPKDHTKWWGNSKQALLSWVAKPGSIESPFLSLMLLCSMYVAVSRLPKCGFARLISL